MKRSARAFTTALIACAFWIGLVPIVEAQPTLRIGATLSQTGAYAAIGQIQLRAYQLCVKHTNDKGGVLGRKLELVVEDDQSQSATAIRICERRRGSPQIPRGAWTDRGIRLRTLAVGA